MFINNKLNKNIFKVIYQNLDMANAISDPIIEDTQTKIFLGILSKVSLEDFSKSVHKVH